MSRADDIKRSIEVLARDLAELEKFSEDVFEDETVLVIKKGFEKQSITVSPTGAIHTNLCRINFSNLYYIDSEMTFEEARAQMCDCGADKIVEHRYRRTYTYAALKVGGYWYVTGRNASTQLDWDGFVSWLRNATILEAYVATEYEAIPEWVAE